MKARTIEEIEKVFREMGLTEETWGQKKASETEAQEEPSAVPQIFIRIETTSTPLEEKTNANVA